MDVLFNVKVIREYEIDLTRLVKRFSLFRQERKAEARKIVLQLRKLVCPMTGMTVTGRSGEPCQRLARMLWPV